MHIKYISENKRNFHLLFLSTYKRLNIFSAIKKAQYHTIAYNTI